MFGPVCQIENGATFVKVDRIYNKKDNSPALLFQGVLPLLVFPSGIVHCVLVWDSRPQFKKLQYFLYADDGGGMNPESIRKCMSLGYSSKTSNTTIGQCNYWHILF